MAGNKTDKEKIDSAPKKNGGARPGAGRPKGSENESTKLRRLAKLAFQDRVAAVTDRLFNSQYDLAIGEKYLMVKRVEGEGKNRRTWVEVVEDVGTISQYIEDDGASLNEDSGEDYYYMTTKPANNMALDSLLNRAYGKADEKLTLANDEDNPINDRMSPEIVADWTEFLKNKTHE